MKVHIDTDIGGDTDDLCALAMVLKWPDVEITGITTVAEENGKKAGYVKHILQLAGKESIPVRAGADVTGGYYRHAIDYPPEKEFWLEYIQPSPNPEDEAIELLKESIEQNAIIIGIGEYTNLALLEKKYPGMLQKVNLSLMGGYISPIPQGYPQWENDMDYNIQMDVESAKFVLEHSNPTLVPMNVTIQTAIRRSYLPQLQKAGKIGELIALQAEAHDRKWQNEGKLGKVYERLPDDFLNFQHDPLTCAIALGWDGVKIEGLALQYEVRDGWLHESMSENGKKVKVVTAVDGDKFNDFWLEKVTS